MLEKCNYPGYLTTYGDSRFTGICKWAWNSPKDRELWQMWFAMAPLSQYGYKAPWKLHESSHLVLENAIQHAHEISRNSLICKAQFLQPVREGLESSIFRCSSWVAAGKAPWVGLHCFPGFPPLHVSATYQEGEFSRCRFNGRTNPTWLLLLHLHRAELTTALWLPLGSNVQCWEARREMQPHLCQPTGCYHSEENRT